MSELITIQPQLKDIITPEQAWFYRILPKSRSADLFTLYCDDSDSDGKAEELEMLFGVSVKLVKVDEDVIIPLLNQHYRNHGLNGERIANNTSKTDFLNRIISEAFRLGSSDIHVEIYDKKARVRIRIDGHLIERFSIEVSEYAALVNQIKIRSKVDIAERRLPQDGRMIAEVDRREIEMRVSVLPTLYGEKVVLRILNRDSSRIELTSLGFSEEQIRVYEQASNRTSGIILISGPTGSGKTTTLYATLKKLNDSRKNIVTIEDPIEYTLEGINQVQLREKIGLDFAKALKTFLRQDPDIIMLGEIRDVETAQMAIRAALTGHLVLSTIHTNSAWGIISRLMDMGIPNFLLEGTINIAMAQRLVRTLCPSCKASRELSEEKRTIGRHKLPKEVHVPIGCDHCYYTGYQGRKAIYEVIPFSGTLFKMLSSKEANLDDVLSRHGVTPLHESAIEMLENGMTSIEEIYPILLDN
ncbi:MAG TPA: type II/IV secretion system protein [Flavobacteriales bacterium]|jgi:type IV pilus assembly protein PilB|nr:type II/IV secretion system protein [Flavobacteriales bacterium]